LDLAKFIVFVPVGAWFLIGANVGFERATQVMVSIVVVGVVLFALGMALAFMFRRMRNGDGSGAPAYFVNAEPLASSEPLESVARAGPAELSSKDVLARLERIDWFQFEKFCAAILQAEGYAVERRGGAHPDGGVDLIAEKDGVRNLIQCKHWRSWNVQEKIVREMLGSMMHFQVAAGVIMTMKGWTAPAAILARQHGIALISGMDLADSAVRLLSREQLEALLDESVRHCPKCEAPMVLRTGNFEPFWGCSRYPRCRGKIKAV